MKVIRTSQKYCAGIALDQSKRECTSKKAIKILLAKGINLIYFIQQYLTKLKF